MAVKSLKFREEDVAQEPYIAEDGIYAPNIYGNVVFGQLIISKEMFIEAYNKWIAARGQWVRPFINKYGHPCHCCSECGFEASQQDKNYCPNCGVKMYGGIEDE